MLKAPTLCFLALSVVTARVGVARPVAIATDTPFEAVDAHVEDWIKAHPKEAKGYCTLGEIHALAWGYGNDIPIIGAPPDALPAFSEETSVLVTRAGPDEMRIKDGNFVESRRKERPVTAEDAKHLAASVAAYRKAIALDPNDALSELGLGWMLAQVGKYASELRADYWEDAKRTDGEKAAWSAAVKQLGDDDARVRDAGSKALLEAMPGCARMLREVKTTDPEVKARVAGVFQDYFELQALEHYRKAFALRSELDMKAQPRFDADSQISAEAGEQIVEILAQRPEAAKKGEVTAVQAVVVPLKEKRQALLMGPQ